MTHEGRGTDCLDQRDPLVWTPLSGDMLDRGPVIRNLCFSNVQYCIFIPLFFHFIYRYLARV